MMMNKQALAEALEELKNIRAENEKEEAARRDKAEEACPRLKELLEERHRMIMDAVRGMFGAAQEEPEKIMENYNRMIRETLRGNGFPEDWLQPIFSCEKCRDTGYAGDSVCSCLEERVRAILEKKNAAAGQTFESFDANVFPDDEILAGYGVTQRKLMEKVRDLCRKYADALPLPAKRTLVLSGGSGLGKTFLLSAIAARAEDRGMDVMKVTAYRAFTLLRENFFGRDEEDEARRLFDAELLLIDDLGMEPLMQNVTVEQVYNLLNERVVNGKCTVISTNLTAENLRDRYTDRVHSRLTDAGASRFITLSGKDIRQLKR